MTSNIIKKKLIFVLSSVFIIGVAVHTYWLDGITGAFYELVWGDTVYSSGYREYKFKRIHNGMSEKNVVDILGQPLFKNPFYPNVWNYSYGVHLLNEYSSKNDNYTQRIVEFEDGHVIDIHHTFYFN